MPAQIEEQQEQLEALPPNLDYEAPLEESVEAPAEAEPEVDWKAKWEEAERGRSGILRELREERQANRERDQRLEEIRQSLAQRQEPIVEEVPPPSKDDPVAYLDHRLSAIEQSTRERLDAIGTMTIEQRQRADQEAEQGRLYEQARRLEMTVNESARKMASESPDYPEAVKYGANLLREHLAAQGVAQDQLEGAVATEFYGIAVRAIQSGSDPAKAIYDTVKRFGYRAPEGAAAAPAPAPSPAPVRAGRSLSNVGGASGANARVTQEQFLAMPLSQQHKLAMDDEKMNQLVDQGYFHL